MFVDQQNYTLSDLQLPLKVLVISIVVYSIILQLLNKTKRNMVSNKINLIWSLNFVKSEFTNRFYSIEKHQEYSKSLEEYVEHHAETYIKQRERELTQEIERLKTSIRRITQNMGLPTDVLESYIRVDEMINNALMDASNSRNSFESVLDHILSEICSVHILNGMVTQGTIMLLNGNDELEVEGLYRFRNNTRSPVKRGEMFAGKVLEQTEMIVIEDIYQENATHYGFGPSTDPDKTYNAVMGVPIKSKTYDSHENVGVINLHFREYPGYEQKERVIIMSILKVYSQFIVTWINLHRNGIIK